MMRAMKSWVLAVVVGGITCAGARAAIAADAEVSVTTAPMRYIVVDGASGKFQAHHWMNVGYAGGIKDASGHLTLPNGTEISAEGHALIDANDLGAELAIHKEHLGFFHFDYSEFRKYFDTRAGAHRQFSTLQAPDTDKDLRLDIGKFGLETGLTLEDWPELSFAYEREFKDGTKSRLTWASAKEVGEARYIAPSWQEIDETVDAFAVKASDELAGFALHGEQRWEFSRAELLREEKFRATTGTASDTKIRQQSLGPQSILLTTTLGSERSFLEDKVVASSGYHFNRLNSRETETMTETSATGVRTNYSRGENKIDARSDNDYESHTWVQNVMVNPSPSVSFGVKLKSEVISRHGNSTYPWYSEYVVSPEAFDEVMDHTEVTLSDAKSARWGEAFSVRFTGIPRTALFTELELEQSRILLREDRKSNDGPDTGNDSVASEVFQRETVVNVRRGAWTLGGQTNPWPFVDLTTQVRRRVHNNDYDDQREFVGPSGARSAFFDGQSIHTNELSTRLTFKPCRWFRPSFRYQLRDDKYATRAESQQIVKTKALSNIYTFDVMAQPVRDLITTATFSRQTAFTKTPAQLISVSPGSGLPRDSTPTFNADVNTWLFSADYTVRTNVTLSSMLQYTRANNFNDFSPSGQPYGADFRKLDLTTGVTWSPTQLEDTSIIAEYGLYTYNPNENVEPGEYVAHAMWLEVSKKF